MKKILSLILVVSLLFTLVPSSIFADTNNKKTDKTIIDVPIVNSIPDEILLDGAQTVRGPVITRKNIVPGSTGPYEAAKIIIIAGLSTLVRGYLGISLTVTSVANALLAEYDFVAYGGVYTKEYYVRKIVDPSTSGASVPVPYQYSWVTVVYNNAAMTDQYIVGVDWINDGGPRLARNNVIE